MSHRKRFFLAFPTINFNNTWTQHLYDVYEWHARSLLPQCPNAREFYTTSSFVPSNVRVCFENATNVTDWWAIMCTTQFLSMISSRQPRKSKFRLAKSLPVFCSSRICFWSEENLRDATPKTGNSECVSCTRHNVNLVAWRHNWRYVVRTEIFRWRVSFAERTPFVNQFDPRTAWTFSKPIRGHSVSFRRKLMY